MGSSIDQLRNEITSLLVKHWGHQAFRPLQEDIILNVLAKKDVLALLPTGGGKSVCFQIPGIVLGGTTLVISPLIALMNDQVQNLRAKGLSAVSINSAMSRREIDIALNNAALGHVQFLYVSPERLQNEDFRSSLAHLPITLIAVDEAHCISQWGYDFRPSYVKIAELRPYFPGVNVVALTASATVAVVKDICEKLGITATNVFRQSFARPNLRYVVQQEENKLRRLSRVLNNIPGSGIVYLRNRKRTEELAAWLNKETSLAQAYHAGLKYDVRKKIQEDWISNKTRVICATNAFGMGIDKPDVRFVVHMDLPDSLEAYFQEAGRGGRDGKTSYSAIFFTTADQKKLRENFELAFPSLEQIKNVYQAICNYYQVAQDSGEGYLVEFDIERICNSYNLASSIVFNSIKFLEKENYLLLIDGGAEASKVMVNAGKETIYDFEIRHPKYEPLIKTLLRSYGGLFENYVQVSERDLASRSKTSSALVTEALLFLDKQNLISYLPQSELPKLVFTRNREQAKHMNFSHQNYQMLKEQHLQRIRAVIDYTDNGQVCRQTQLLQYFGESSEKECGFCDVCISKKEASTEKIKNVIREKLNAQPRSLEELRRDLFQYRDETWVKAFHELLDDGIVSESGALYKLNKKDNDKMAG